MKLKLFIITLIAISFAVTGLLGGCGGKKNKDEPQDKTLDVFVNEGDNTYYAKWGTVDGKVALAGYDDDDNLIWLAVYRENNNNYISADTLYVLSGVTGGNDQIISCGDNSIETYVDFTAKSSKSNIAELDGPYADSYGDICYSTTSYDETGTAKIRITTANGKKTWFTVIVVDGMSAAPTFTPDPPSGN